jgi:hypothetical protein
MITIAVAIVFNKKDLSTEEGRALYLAKEKKQHSLKGKLSNLIHLAYFGYIFLALVDLIK